MVFFFLYRLFTRSCLLSVIRVNFGKPGDRCDAFRNGIQLNSGTRSIWHLHTSLWSVICSQWESRRSGRRGWGVTVYICSGIMDENAQSLPGHIFLQHYLIFLTKWNSETSVPNTTRSLEKFKFTFNERKVGGSKRSIKFASSLYCKKRADISSLQIGEWSKYS